MEGKNPSFSKQTPSSSSRDQPPIICRPETHETKGLLTETKGAEATSFQRADVFDAELCHTHQVI